MKPTHSSSFAPVTSWLSALVFAGIVHNASAADVFKADVPDALNLGSSWTGNTAPGANDVAVWNSAVSAANTISVLGSDLGWLGIRIVNPGATVIISAGNTLTNGASGVDLSAATQDLTLDNNVEIGTSQTWSVAAGRSLTLSTPLAGAGTNVLTKDGAGTLVLSSTVNGSFSGPTVVNAGILQLNSANGNNNSALGTGFITNNGATLRLGAARIIGNALHFNGDCIVDANGFGSPMDGAWSGAATVQLINLTNSSATFTIGGNGNGGGNMNNFTGTLRLADDTTATLRFNNGGGNNNVGNANTTFDFGNSSAVFFSRNRNATVNFGELRGGPNTTIRQGASSSGTTTYSIGGKNTDSAFAGQIIDGGTAAAGLVAITKVGSGTLTLTGTNTYLGATTINEGTLRIGAGGIVGTLGAGQVINNASLVLNRSDDYSIANSITGQGTLTKLGAGTLTLEGTNSSSGAMLVNQGTFALGAAGAISSPVSLASGVRLDVTANPAFAFSQTLSGAGSVVGAFTASGGTLNPGGAGAAGTLTFSNGLVEQDNVSHQMEFSTPGGTNDLVQVVGDLMLTGTNFIFGSHFGGGAIPPGTYTLFKYTGNLVGGLGNLSAVLVGANGVFTNPPKEVALIVTPSGRGPTNLTWSGDGGANNWDTGGSANWKNGAVASTFLASDSVQFDNSGAVNPNVNLVGTLLPAAVTVNAANNFTFTGVGAIGGATGLTKTNSGTLTILTTNLYTGPTLIKGGTLEVSTLANGGTASAIGAASGSPANLVLAGATLRYSGASTGTDRGVTLEDGTNSFTVADPSATLTLAGLITGPGAMVKNGPGELDLDFANNYSGGTAVREGVLRPVNGALGSGPLTLNGGTIPATLRFAADAQALNNVLSVVGLNNYITNAGNNTLQDLVGSGTLHLDVATGTTLTIAGNMSTFSGTLAVNSLPNLRFHPSTGSSNAVVDLGLGSALLNCRNGNLTIQIGALIGGPGTIMQGASSADNPTTYVVGGRNLSTTFEGSIQEVNANRVVSIVKVGTGTWTLGGVNAHSGSTTISNGVLAVGANGSIDNTAAIRIASPGVLDVSARFDQMLNLGHFTGQTLTGDGVLRGSLNVGPIGTNAPGLPVGKLTVTNTITLGSGSYTIMELDRAGAPNSDKLVGAAITLGGNLVVENIGPNLQVGDTFDLFDGPLAGNFESVILPSLYTFNTNNLTVNGTIVVTGAPVAPRINAVTLEPANGVVLSGNAGLALANTPYYVLSSTNIAAPLATWTPVLTNVVQPDGSFFATNPVVSGTPQGYFRLMFP